MPEIQPPPEGYFDGFGEVMPGPGYDPRSDGDVPDQDVLPLLRKNRKGSPVASRMNTAIILEKDPKFLDKIVTNEMDGMVYVDGKPICDENETWIKVWIEEVYGFQPADAHAGQAINAIGDKYKFHPLRDLLDGLKWDGKRRLQEMLPLAFGAENNALHRAYSWKWGLSAVARAYQPGCKVDTTLILTGAQGAGKSTAIQYLAMHDEWFCDALFDIQRGLKDFYEVIQGVWLYEIGELDSFRGQDRTKIKAILSGRTDAWRRPYGKRTVRLPRQCVFIGTTNDDRFLDDSTGSRRFWPVPVGRIDLPWVLANREQVWAEAVAAFKGGEQWWLDEREEAARVDAALDFEVLHPWFEKVAKWVEGRIEYTVADVLEHALEKKPGTWKRADDNVVSDIIKSIGHVRKGRITREGKKVRVWGCP